MRRSDTFHFHQSLSMNRVAGIETEYGCLVTGDHGPEAWPVRVKNYQIGRAHV